MSYGLQWNDAIGLVCYGLAYRLNGFMKLWSNNDGYVVAL